MSVKNLKKNVKKIGDLKFSEIVYGLLSEILVSFTKKKKKK